MGLGSFLSANGVIAKINAKCKREALSLLAGRCAELTNIDQNILFESLMEREQLGSTAVGHGVAIPHGKIEGLDKLTGILITLSDPVDFDAADDAPVDILFGLLAPADASAAHLKALAKVSRLLREERNRTALRATDSIDAIYAIATQTERSDAA